MRGVMFVGVILKQKFSKVVRERGGNVRFARADGAPFRFGVLRPREMRVARRAPFAAPIVPGLHARGRANEIVILHALGNKTRQPVLDRGLDFIVRHNSVVGAIHPIPDVEREKSPLLK